MASEPGKGCATRDARRSRRHSYDEMAVSLLFEAKKPERMVVRGVFGNQAWV